MVDVDFIIPAGAQSNSPVNYICMVTLERLK